ncbi:MAG: DNA starvation/stationary phase protection protein [Gammaproteobacteria bacterium]|nr:DNA starvation/stationary phase protection protein [Gammaproteobacteria bacterium]
MSNTQAAMLKSVPNESNIDNGVNRGDRRELALRLSEALADSYMLYLKTQNVHWNVVGPNFYSIHELTEKQYEDMAEAVDVIAERIRAIGFTAPGSFTEFANYTALRDDNKERNAEEMVRHLMESNEMISKRLRSAAEEAENVQDVRTADLLTERIGQHEENAWMLRSIIS